MGLHFIVVQDDQEFIILFERLGIFMYTRWSRLGVGWSRLECKHTRFGKG